MIKFLPNIYPDEIVYSYLSRCYAASGYIWNYGFSREILENTTAPLDSCFLNVFSREFKELLEEKIGLDKLILNHTLFKHYTRFLPLEKRREVLKKAISNQLFLIHDLPISRNTNTNVLRYCPECVKEDRLKYGESYIHTTHTIPHIYVCPRHCCELIEVEFVKSKITNRTYLPLEQVINNMETVMCDQTDINVKLSQYISEVFNSPLDLEKNLIIGNFLSNKLEEKYISPRGEQRNISCLYEDITVFYSGLHEFNLTKNKLSYIYRNLTTTPYEILLVSMFQGIQPNTLSSYEGDSAPRYITFDNRVRELHNSGMSINKIGKVLNVNHEVVRQILIGTYEKPKKQCTTYICQKWDWEKIDNECCKEFYEKVTFLDGKNITKNTVSELFGLKDKRLRNLPKLTALIQEYKKQVRV